MIQVSASDASEGTPKALKVQNAEPFTNRCGTKNAQDQGRRIAKYIE